MIPKVINFNKNIESQDSSGFESEIIKSGDYSENTKEINDLEDVNISKLLD